MCKNGNYQKYSIYAGVKFSAIQFCRTMTTLFPGKHWTNFLHWETLTASSDFTAMISSSLMMQRMRIFASGMRRALVAVRQWSVSGTRSSPTAKPGRPFFTAAKAEA